MSDTAKPFFGSAAEENLSTKTSGDESDLNSLVVEATAALLVVVDRDGRIVRFNRSCETLTGYTFDEVRGRRLWEFLLVDEDVEPVKKIFEQLKASDFPNTHENYWLTKSGERRSIFWSHTALTDAQELVRYVVGTGLEQSPRENYNLLNKVVDEASVTSGEAKQTSAATKPASYNFEEKAADLVGGSHDATKHKQIEESPRTSEEWYRSVIEAMDEGVILLDATGAITAVNASAERILGMTAAQMKTRASFDERRLAVYEDGSPFPDDAHPSMVTLRTGKSCRNVMMGVCRADDEIVWICVNSQPVFNDGESTASGVVTTFSNVTGRRLIDERLRLLESAVKQSNDAILITDAELDPPGPKIIFANPAFQTMTGYDLKEILGRTPRILQGAKTERRVLDEMRRCLSRGEDFRGSTFNYRKDGSEYVVEWSVSPIKNERGEVTSFIAVQQDITERQRAERALLKSEEQYRFLADSIPQQVWTARRDGRLDYSNKHALDYFEKFSGQALADDWLDAIHPDDLPSALECWTHAVQTGTPYEIEFRLRRASDETYRWHLGRAVAMRDETGRIVKWFGTNTDIDDRKRVEEALRANEEQLRQAQKMESVGRLAGGIAHDFNNMLTAISGYSTLTLRKLKADDPLVKNINEISKAAERSAALTRQLLAFSRQQMQQLRVLNINRTIEELRGMLERLVGEDVELTENLDPALGAVKADTGQIEQILMNLVVNARDAMPDGGRIIVETANVFLGDDFVKINPGSKSGAYIRLSVSDTGFGIDAEIRKQIFEPFFTTKEIGKGTGLGLSTVYGIVKQSDGYITVESRLGHGATFDIYLPRVNQAEEIPESSPVENAPVGGETILLAEDEEIVRNLTMLVLESAGYRVIATADGGEALDVCRTYEKSIDLLLTDIVMPELSGRKLAEQILPMRPGLKVIYMSGYNEQFANHQDKSKSGIAFLEKPFAPEDVLAKVREVLDAPV